MKVLIFMGLLAACGSPTATTCYVRLELRATELPAPTFSFMDGTTCRAFLVDGSGPYTVRAALNNVPSIGHVNSFTIGSTDFATNQFDLTVPNSQAAFFSDPISGSRPLPDGTVAIVLSFQAGLFEQSVLPRSIDVSFTEGTPY